MNEWLTCSFPRLSAKPTTSSLLPGFLRPGETMCSFASVFTNGITFILLAKYKVKTIELLGIEYSVISRKF